MRKFEILNSKPGCQKAATINIQQCFELDFSETETNGTKDIATVIMQVIQLLSQQTLHHFFKHLIFKLDYNCIYNSFDFKAIIVSYTSAQVSF